MSDKPRTEAEELIRKEVKKQAIANGVDPETISEADIQACVTEFMKQKHDVSGSA